MRVIVSGGGTGGHIYPAVTLIRAIQKLRGDAAFLYVGTQRGLEADIIPKEGLPFETVDIRGFERKLSLRNVATLAKSAASVWHAGKIVRRFRPDVAIGTGGYVCGPVLLAASLMGVPTMIQEQNVIPGITNKILSKCVTKIALGYAEAKAYFPAEKAVFTGNPIRDEVMTADRAAAARFALDPAKCTVLVSGGSRGARTINRAMVGAHCHFAGSRRVQILHVTGKAEYEDIAAKLRAAGIDAKRPGNSILVPYLYDMPSALAAADLAIFRAGAMGLAEITAKGIPALLVPYPYAAENHQEHNARAMERRGAARVVLDRDLTAEKCVAFIEEFAVAEEKRAAMRAASRAMGRPEAAAEIAALALALAEGR